MLYSTQNYLIFGPCPSSGILETRKHNVSETGLRLCISKRPNRVGVFLRHLQMETDPVSETLCFLVSRTLDDGQSAKRQ
jgi:hypothetical protein